MDTSPIKGPICEYLVVIIPCLLGWGVRIISELGFSAVTFLEITLSWKWLCGLDQNGYKEGKGGGGRSSTDCCVHLANKQETKEETSLSNEVKFMWRITKIQQSTILVTEKCNLISIIPIHVTWYYQILMRCQRNIFILLHSSRQSCDRLSIGCDPSYPIFIAIRCQKQAWQTT